MYYDRNRPKSFEENVTKRLFLRILVDNSLTKVLMKKEWAVVLVLEHEEHNNIISILCLQLRDKLPAQQRSCSYAFQMFYICGTIIDIGQKHHKEL